MEVISLHAQSRCRLVLLFILVSTLLVLPLVTLDPEPAHAQGGTYFVAPCGDDANTGLSADCGAGSGGPFRTIQQAAKVAQAGDRVEILPGIYRETVTIRRSGAPGAPITFEAAQGRGTAFIYGSENARSFSWRSEGDGVYSADISQLPHTPELIYEKGVPADAFDGWPNYPEITFFREIGDGMVKYPKAHEPDFTVDEAWKYHQNWATADGGNSVWDDAAARAGCPASPRDSFLDCMSKKMTANSSLVNLTDQNRDGDGLDLRQYADLTGAVLYMLDTRSAYYAYRRVITSFDKTQGKVGWQERADFDYRSGVPGIGPFSKYIIEGKRAFLDRSMEWAVEGDRLFLKTRTGASPETLDLEIAVRHRGIDFSEQSYLTFRNLDIFFVNNAQVDEMDIQYGEGALLAFNYNRSSDGTTIEGVRIAHGGKGIKFRQPKVNQGLLSQHVTLRDSEIFDLEGIAFANVSYSYDEGQTGAFPYLTIDGNHIHHVGFRPVMWAPYAIALGNAYKVIVTDNYIHDTAHKCIHIGPPRGEYILVKDNALERCGLNHSEASGIGIGQWGHVYTKTLFMGNVVRNNLGWTFASANGYWNGGGNYNGVSFFRGMSGSGVNQDGGDGVRVYRNLFVNNSHLCTAVSSGYMSNNVCIGSRYGIRGGNRSSPESFPFAIQNNILFENYYGVETYPTDVHRPTIDYNLYEQSQSLRDQPDDQWHPVGHLLYPDPSRTTAANTYERVCDPEQQSESICHNFPWENHGVEDDHRPIFVDPTDLSTVSIFDLKGKLRLASNSKAIDAGVEPTEFLALIQELESGLGIEIEDEPLQGSAYDIGAFEYRGTATFADVPFDHPYHDAIEALYQAGYTAGCGTDPLRYCPDQAMSRAESAVFVQRGVHGVDVQPGQPASQTFADLPLESWAAKWAEALYTDGYTAGCGTDPLRYCPWQGHTRAEGAVFYLRMLNGADYQPPAAEGIFSDVPAEAWYARWAEAAYQAGLIPACGEDPLRFCPDDPLTRGLAASMMVRAKSLPLP